ncbi:MAG: FHA domain-containing protein [Roseburia sp.]|nr:FHA domain-containing protein [Roseburia sp.]
MEYRRCQGKSYMIREAQTSEWGYQIPMLRENTVKGILPVQKMQEGEKVQFWYEISGKHDLEGYARFHKLGRKFLENFIVSLCRVSQSLGEYLLLEDEICLDPEMIYLNYNEKEISFCYIPGSQKKLEASLSDFMEFFLKHMEHGEQKDIEVCYKVYEKSQMERISLPELAEIMSRDVRQEEQKSVFSESASTWENPVALESGKEEPERRKEKFRFPGKFFERKYSFYNVWDKIPKRQKKEQEQFIFEPEEVVEESSNPTVFLGSESKEIFGELRYEGEGRGNNFKINVPVFLVGSQEGEANGVIFTSSVSRHHAIIYKEEDNYYIEDLNSTNGTYLNGKALNYKEKVLLSKNDKVRFAEEAYRFV